MVSVGVESDEARAAHARRAWAWLSAAFMAQRPQWLAASQAEGLTPPQALSLLRLNPDDPPRLGDLARFLRCDASQVTATADRLEERGLAERRTAPDDRRVKELVPTPEGLRAQARLRAAFLATPPGLAQLDDDELRVLVAVAERLAVAVDAEVRHAFGLPPASGAAPTEPG